METGKPHTAHLGDVAEKAVAIHRLIIQAKELSDELVATVNLLNSVVQTREQNTLSLNDAEPQADPENCNWDLRA